MTRPAVSGASPTKRRTKAEMQVIRTAIRQVAETYRPATVRQVFYRLVGMGVVNKTENEYKHTVCRLLVEMRREYEIPFGWIADNTRWMRKPRTYSGLREVLNATSRMYRRDMWESQDAYVEIWCEKEALAGALYRVTETWGVPLMVTRGYPSLTYIYEAAEAIAAEDKPCYLYYLGDWDPSGLDIARCVEQQVEEFAPGADITFERVAVTAEQITGLQLPTRPTKLSDSRSKHFRGESVEVDALPPDVPRRIVEDCITQHIDPDEWDRLKRIEREEQTALNEFIGTWAS